MIRGLDHVQLAAPAGSEERARTFFGGLLGLQELAKPEQLATRGGVWFACGEHELHIGVEPDFRPARKAHPAFRVSDVDALGRRLRDAGLEPRGDQEIPGVRRFYVDDPFGNRLEFTESGPDGG